MRKIEMSFAASIAVKSDNGFLIIGNDGMALLDEKGDLGQFQKFKVVSQLHFDRNAEFDVIENRFEILSYVRRPQEYRPGSRWSSLPNAITVTKFGELQEPGRNTC
ncbi:MAG: hypothetical protein IPJ30_12960 [Acidobacteria bacterium]|nr:hypothetical protein [Acidobacteriota bacterium]